MDAKRTLQTYYMIGHAMRERRENTLKAKPIYCKHCQEFMTLVDRWETSRGVAEAFECKKCGRAVNGEIISIRGVPVTVENISMSPGEFKNEYTLIRRGNG